MMGSHSMGLIGVTVGMGGSLLSTVLRGEHDLTLWQADISGKIENSRLTY